ncbi:tRNA (adenosine(37)-N6)-dimethylallyltransferase MiaA [Natranaerobius trueperi]|uniref:tRNA dimethylallyltransferase n=1 Tax=Natranaerobius trueperi TaxID=759412 RepID=A0A226BY44_9FIRM|nr:tRNA (adenosine(37)-N6)-dimethylallyltransferase MiaA [Natranaerobius trueperi]
MLDAKPLLAIIGPTAVGKTAISLEVAKKIPINVEIISADSMQLYKQMDIGTAKPSTSDQQEITHHFIDSIDPSEDYSVGRYQEEAKQVIKDIYHRGNLPVVVGGTGLYVNALLYDYSLNALPKSSSYREELLERAKIQGLQALYNDLQNKDPEAAEKIHPNDKQRIIRALEVFYQTGEPISKRQQRKYSSPYNLLFFGLFMDRPLLYERIEKRVDKMIEQGLLGEVKSLLENGYTLELTAMKGLGYKEIGKYLQGEYTFDEAINILKKDTKRFAKRQLTWFRRDPNIKWYDLTNNNTGEISNKIVEKVLKEYFEKPRNI